MKKYSIKIAFILIGISLSACNGTPTTTNNQKLEEREEHHEEGGNLTTLTQAQIQTVDIRLGHIEEKALAATRGTKDEFIAVGNDAFLHRKVRDI